MKTLKIIKKEYQRIGYDENDIQPVEYLEVSAQYNDHGQILREERFDPDGNLNTLTVNNYNDNHLLWKTEQYDMDNILLQKTVNEYDDQQQLVQENNFFGESDQVYVTRLIYDEDGNLLRREMYFEGQLDYVENIYEYKDGLLVKEVENDEYGKELNVHTYSYNDKGLLAQHVRDEVQKADAFIIIGTSLNVYPAAGLVQYVRPQVPVYLIDPAPVPTSGYRTIQHIQKGASEGMRELMEIFKKQV